MRYACHLVPLLVFAALPLSGCYLAHGLDSPGDPGDAGPPPRTADGGRHAMPTPVRPDAGGPAVDAGPLECPEVRADFSCFSSFPVAAGFAFDLPATFETCVCCAASECRVERRTVLGQEVLDLTTTLCEDPCDCDSCELGTVACHVPALEEGVYHVLVNGAPAFTLPVFEDSGLVPPPPACVEYAEVDTCATPDMVRLDPSGWRPSEVCVQEGLSSPSQAFATVVSSCFSCGDLHGPCTAELEQRFTDDLPPGGEIRLAPTSYGTWCDVDCPEICIRAERRCALPDLVPGQFYRVWADGEVMLSFTAGEDGPHCAGTD